MNFTKYPLILKVRRYLGSHYHIVLYTEGADKIQMRIQDHLTPSLWLHSSIYILMLISSFQKILIRNQKNEGIDVPSSF